MPPFGTRPKSTDMPYTTLIGTSVIFRFSKDALSLHSSIAQKRIFVFNNIARLETVPEELSEKYFQRLFETAKIANFTADEHKSYLEKQKMKYDYENVPEYV